MNGVIAFWVRNSVAANLLMVVAILGGVWGYSQLEKETFPGGEFNGASIEISWPDAATPMMVHSPHPRWVHSRAERMRPTLPTHSKE